MAHIMIADNTPEGKWLLDLIKDHKSVTVIDENRSGFEQAAQACNAVSVVDFTDELRKRIRENRRNNA